MPQPLMLHAYAHTYADDCRYFDKAAMQDRVRNLPYLNQNTNTAAALRAMTSQVYTGNSSLSGDRPAVRNIAVVLTDGKSTVNADDTLPAAEAAQAAGVQIFSIGITPNVSVSGLSTSASRPTSRSVAFFMLYRHVYVTCIINFLSFVSGIPMLFYRHKKIRYLSVLLLVSICVSVVAPAAGRAHGHVVSAASAERQLLHVSNVRRPQHAHRQHRVGRLRPDRSVVS